MIQWTSFPRSKAAPQISVEVVGAFNAVATLIDSARHQLESNEVLAHVAPGLRKLGFSVESGKRAEEKISVPVLFGMNGCIDKWFDVDAHHPTHGYVLEVEAGRGVINFQFLKDLFQACMMHDVFHLAIAVRNTYRSSPDFEKVCRFFETLFASQRLQLPLESILIIGY